MKLEKIIKKIGVCVLVVFVAACATSQAPVEEARAQQGNYNSEGVFENGPAVNDEEIGSADMKDSSAIDRSAPPVIGKLLHQSELAAEQEDWVKAESYLQRALRISPKNAFLWHKMAKAKLKQGKNNQAAQFASKSNAISTDVRLQKVNNEIILASRE